MGATFHGMRHLLCRAVYAAQKCYPCLTPTFNSCATTPPSPTPVPTPADATASAPRRAPSKPPARQPKPRPRHSPRRTAADLEQRVLDLRDQFGWGPRKLHALLRGQCPELPSVRTLANILKRHDRLRDPTPPPPAPQRFERSYANDLWQA